MVNHSELDMSESKRRVIFPGSFDPFTLGHLDLVRKASRIFDEVIIAISRNTGAKQTLFSLEERFRIVQRDIVEAFGAKNQQVSVQLFEGLLVEYMRQQHINFIMRGIRNSLDFEYETNMFEINRMLDLDDIEAVFFLPSPGKRHISSSAVRELACLGYTAKGLEDFVTPETATELLQKY